MSGDERGSGATERVGLAAAAGRPFRVARTPRAGTLERLVRERRRVRRSFAGLLIFVSLVIALDLVVGGARSRSVDLGFNILYGACGSVLATVLVAGTQVRFRIREAQEQAGEALRLLGIDPGRPSRVALVVTTWKSGRRGGPAPRRPDGFLNPHTAYPDELDDSIYVRRDMLLVADLMRLLQKSGLDAPIIVSDVEFLNDARQGRRDQHITVNVGDGRREAVTNVILVGLWGNKITQVLSDTEDAIVPFTLASENGQEIRLFSPDAKADHPYGRYRQMDERLQDEGKVKSVKGYALVARFHFEDVGVSVLGGAYGLPTARLGDFLLTRPAAADALWSIPPGDDFWVGVQTPAHGDRFGAYWVDVPRVKHGQVTGRRLADLLRAQTTLDLNRFDPAITERAVER